MLKVEPTKVVFRDLRLNQPYTTSLCITNPLDVSVDFAIRPNHSRYQVSPSSVHLEPGKSIVVTLKAYLSNYPKINRGEKGFNDFILLVSSFFQQKIDLNLTFPKDTENHEPSSNHNTSSERTNPQAFSDEKFPDFEAILEERIQQERAAFEEQSQKALALLYSKDKTIESLRTELEILTEKLNMNSNDGGNLNQESTSKDAISIRENELLQERIADQAEQIEILISEISRLRQEERNSNSENSQIFENNSNLLEEIRKYKDRCEELESLLVQKEMTSKECPPILQDNYVLHQLQERVSVAEQAAEELRLRHRANIATENNLQERENQLREHLLQLQTQEEDLRRREEVLSLNLNNVNLDDNQINLPIKHDSIKSSECHHQWWTYIWHSLQQQSSSTEIDKCDNIVESQGLTIVKLRQAQILESLKYAELRRRSQDEIEELTREINRLKMHIKNHRNDNETRYIELNRTIKILSSKSDLHAELMQCRHELQLERLLVENLRRDVEAYQSMLGAEQSKCERMKHDLLECEASCRRSEILQSLESVPGLSPAKLIEIFSGRIQSLEKELQQSKLLNRTPNLMPSSTPNDEYSEEIKRALVRKQGDDFLPSLNNALLIQKIFDLEIVVREQNLQIQELMQDSTTKGEVTSLKTGEEDVQNTSEKLLLLAQESLSQARNEIKHLKFQLELCQDREAATRAQLCSLRSTILCVCCQKKIENFDPPSNEEVEEYRDESLTLVQENENLKSLVRERTTQLKVLMETLDAVHINVNHSLTEKNFLEEPTHSSSNWEIKSLINRLITLTSEAAAQAASVEMSNRRVRLLEESSLKMTKQCHESKLLISRYERAIFRLQKYTESLGERIRCLENNHRQQLTFLQSQIDEFVEELKVKENSLNEATIQLEELRKQVVKNDEKILRNLILAEEDSNGMEYHCQIEDSTEDVRALVVSLLVQWRDQVGFYPRAAKAQISKAEEKFLQNVTDLVMESHQRATKSEHRLRTLQFSNYQLERQKKVQTIHLQRVMMALVKSQRKSSLYDEFGLKVSLEHLKQEVTVSTLLKNTNRKLMTMLESISQELISQKCHENHLQNSSCPNIVSNTANTDIISSHREILNYIDDQIKVSESSLRKWFQIELPRLLTGLPVPEEDLQYIVGTPSYQLDISNRLSSLGLDNTYALSQSICSLKLLHHTASMKQIELTESIQMLQSKVQELEALIEHQKSSMAVVIDIPQNQQALILPDLCRLQQENTELSEKLIEYQTQLEYSKSREKTVIQLVEVLRNNAPNIEIEISNAIKQYQEQVEDKYVLDIKELTETYEAEKRTLIQELEKFTESYRIIKKSDSGNQTFDACPQTHEKSAQTESNELHSLAEVNNSPVIESIGPAVSSVDLQRLLDTELLRNQRARERILELESTLEAQRSSFRKHLEREKDLALTDMDLVPTSESEVESITTSPSVIPHSEQISNDIIQAKHNIDQYVDENVIKESSNIKSSAFPSSENYLPDWYFEVLKKLRQRVYDLEHALTQQNLEKYAPTDAAREEIEKIKSSYEDALRNIQSALEEQTQLAKDQIERLEEYVRISRLEVQSSEHEISSTHALVDQYKHKLLTQEKAHAEELQRVWSQFQKYRTAQDLLTSSLETEIRAYVEIEKRFPIESLELREITTLCNTKRSSLQAVLNGLVVLQANTASEGNHDSELRSFREELLEARLLSYERKILELERRIEDSKMSNLPSSEYSVSSDHERLPSTIEVKKLEAVLEEQKQYIRNLKEENTRKSKLLASIKASKSNEATSLEQWKREFHDCEEKLKRMSRSNTNKESIIKDLRSKIALLEKKELEVEDGDISTLSIQDLRRRLKESELERSKLRSKLTIFRDKVSELEHQNHQLNEDAEKAKKIQHNSELLRSEIIRKEATIKTLREALQKSRESLTSTEDSYAAKYHEFDRQIRSLQRQLDILKQKCHTLEEENGSLHSQLNAFNQKIDRDVRSKKTVVEGLTIPMSSEIQEIMAELSADKEFQSPRERKLLSKVKKSNIEDLNVSGTSSDSIDLHSIEKRLKSLVHTAMQYDQQDG